MGSMLWVPRAVSISVVAVACSRYEETGTASLSVGLAVGRCGAQDRNEVRFIDRPK
jgi:hypothetical protein